MNKLKFVFENKFNGNITAPLVAQGYPQTEI